VLLLLLSTGGGYAVLLTTTLPWTLQEAALVAQLWGGQHAEVSTCPTCCTHSPHHVANGVCDQTAGRSLPLQEVVESIGDPQPERPEYRFAGLGPPNMQSEKLRQ
jgi:hypothetical protein